MTFTSSKRLLTKTDVGDLRKDHLLTSDLANRRKKNAGFHQREERDERSGFYQRG